MADVNGEPVTAQVTTVVPAWRAQVGPTGQGVFAVSAIKAGQTVAAFVDPKVVKESEWQAIAETRGIPGWGGIEGEHGIGPPAKAVLLCRYYDDALVGMTPAQRPNDLSGRSSTTLSARLRPASSSPNEGSTSSGWPRVTSPQARSSPSTMGRKTRTSSTMSTPPSMRTSTCGLRRRPESRTLWSAAPSAPAVSPRACNCGHAERVCAHVPARTPHLY